MAKLFTHHDFGHVHAICGILVLLHFFTRIMLWLCFGMDTFSAGPVSVVTLLLHVFLHASSFQFYLPANRLWTKPMIWREFRVHNAIFASRHVVSTMLAIFAPGWWWRSPDLSSVAVKVLLVWIICAAADVATEQLGDREKRTTNAMPYPQGTSKASERVIKLFYATAQMGAASVAAFGPPVPNFACILPIEIASLLMTLVRKGLIEAWHYHLLYAVSLVLIYPVLAVGFVFRDDPEYDLATCRVLLTMLFSAQLRLRLWLNKYLVWGVAITAGYVMPLLLSPYMEMKTICYGFYLLSVVYWPLKVMVVRTFQSPAPPTTCKVFAPSAQSAPAN